jgi:hypothetical protein
MAGGVLLMRMDQMVGLYLGYTIWDTGGRTKAAEANLDLFDFGTCSFPDVLVTRCAFT